MSLNLLENIYQTIVASEYSSKKAREIEAHLSDEMLGASLEKKNSIKAFFIQILETQQYYLYFPFGELIYFFIHNHDEFTQSEIQKISSIVLDNFVEICNSENDMIPFILIDFLSRYGDDKVIKDFYTKVLNKYRSTLNKKEKSYLRSGLRIASKKLDGEVLLKYLNNI